MNINTIIEDIFSDFTFEDQKIPIAPNFYDGDATTYLVYYTESIEPDEFADDMQISEITRGTIDIFTNKNYKNLKKEVKKKIVKECGFTWTGDEKEDYEESTKLWHIPINFVVGSNTTFLND